MLLAVFFPRCTSQIHLHRTLPELIRLEKRVGLHYNVISKSLVVAFGFTRLSRLKKAQISPELRKSG
jgi:hypothetical protein